MERKKSTSVANGAQHAKAAGGGASTAIHELLGMTPEEVDADIASRGKTAMEVLRRFGAMERQAIEQFFQQRGHGSSLAARDYRLDLSHSVHFATPGTEPDWSAVVVVETMLDAGDAELLNDGRLEMSIFLDTKTAPRDGDIVLASIQGEGQTLRRLRQFGLDRFSLEALVDKFASGESGHLSQMIIHGIVVGKATPV